LLSRPRILTLLMLIVELASCAPAGVPTGASVELTLKSGLVWKWTRALHSGCASWMATERWESVRLSVDRARCEDGPGLSYLAGADYLYFRNYWPWPQTELRNMFIFDSHGMVIGMRPCPHLLSPEHLDALRVVAQEALARTATDQERSTLRRIDQRLAAANGAALMSSQLGCTDEREPSPRVDTWTPR
jgi:hypothetical protein